MPPEVRRWGQGDTVRHRARTGIPPQPKLLSCPGRAGRPGGREVPLLSPGGQHLLPYKVISPLPRTASDKEPGGVVGGGGVRPALRTAPCSPTRWHPGNQLPRQPLVCWRTSTNLQVVSEPQAWPGNRTLGLSCPLTFTQEHTHTCGEGWRSCRSHTSCPSPGTVKPGSPKRELALLPLPPEKTDGDGPGLQQVRVCLYPQRSRRARDPGPVPGRGCFLALTLWDPCLTLSERGC